MTNMESLGFLPPSQVVPRRVVATLSGHEKSGKTDMALRTAPEPVFFISLDMGTEGVVHKFVDRDIKMYEVKVPRNQPKEVYVGIWNDLLMRIRAVLDNNQGSLVIDTESECWELQRLATFGRLDQVMPHHWGPINAAKRELVREFYHSDLTVILLHKMSREYKNDAWTGGWGRKGWSDMGYSVQANLETVRHDGDDGTRFGVQVKDCRQNPALNGQIFWDDSRSFEFLLLMVHGS